MARTKETIKAEAQARDRMIKAAENLLESIGGVSHLGSAMALVFWDMKGDLHFLQCTQPFVDALDFRFED